MRKHLVQNAAYEVATQVRAVEDSIDAALAEIAELRRSLSNLAADANATSDAQIRQLCDQMATRSSRTCLDPGTLGEVASSIPGVRPWLLKQHMIDRRGWL